MHEYAIGRNLIDAVCGIYGEIDPPPAALNAAHVVVGALHQIVPEYLADAYTRLAAATPVAGSRLELHPRPVHVTCGDCGWSGEVALPFIRCAACDSCGVKLNSGRELYLERLEVETHD